MDIINYSVTVQHGLPREEERACVLAGLLGGAGGSPSFLPGNNSGITGLYVQDCNTAILQDCKVQVCRTASLPSVRTVLAVIVDSCLAARGGRETGPGSWRIQE